MQEKYLAEIADRFSVPILQIPLLPHEVKGLTVLESLGNRVLGTKGNGCKSQIVIPS
jgi:hypothetical protein